MYSVFILMCVNSITLYLSIFANAAPTVRQNDSDVDNSLHRNNIFLRKPVLEISKRQENDLICEHFPSPCSDNSGLTNCTSRKKCSEIDAYCYTSWTLSDEDKTTETGGIRYQWGSKPQHMGCMVPNSPCNKTCVHDTKPNEKHNHLYCCCSGNNCLTLEKMFYILNKTKMILRHNIHYLCFQRIRVILNLHTNYLRQRCQNHQHVHRHPNLSPKMRATYS